MSFGAKGDNGAAAKQERLMAEDKRIAEAEALRLANEREDSKALSAKKSLADKEAARKKKQLQLSGLSDDSTGLLG